MGAKVAIVSDKPQTTRRAIRGVAGGPGWQLVLVDLPGVQRPRDALTERMQRRVEHELQDADGCLFVINAEEGVGPGDRFIAGLLRAARVPVVIAVNKIDRDEAAGIASALQAAADLDIAGEVFPVSAATGSGLRPLVTTWCHCCPTARSTSKPTSSRTNPNTYGSPSSCASRCWRAPARRCRTRSRWRSRRSNTASPCAIPI